MDKLQLQSYCFPHPKLNYFILCIIFIYLCSTLYLILMIQIIFNLISYQHKLDQQSKELNMESAEAEIYTQGLNLEKIRNAIKIGQQKITHVSSGNNIVIFWGYSGTGKSTTILTLTGAKMYGYHHHQSCLPILMTQDTFQQNKQSGEIFIQPDIYSGTWVPIVKEMKKQENQTEVVNLWDMPGFGDSRGVTLSLINTYYIHRIFDLHKQVKLIFTIKHDDLDPGNKGSSLPNILYELTQGLGNFHNYSQCMALLVTKANILLKAENVIESLKNLLKLQLKNKNSIQNFINFVESGDIPILIITKPNFTGKNIISEQQKLDVTYQYEPFIKNFYDVVTNKLQSATFPHMRGPNMKKEQIEECVKLAQETQKNIADNTKLFIQGLFPYIQQHFILNDISDNAQIFQNSIDKIKRVNEFISKVLQFGKFTVTHKIQQLMENMQKLLKTAQDQEYQYLCSIANDVVQCKPLRMLKDQFIVVDFLSNIDFKSVYAEKYAWIDKALVIGNFFNELAENKEKIMKKNNQEFQKFMIKIQNRIQEKIIYSVEKWQSHPNFIFWTKKIKMFPSFYLKSTKFMDLGLLKTFSYFEQLKENEKLFGFDTEQISTILMILQLLQSNFTRTLNYDIFIEGRINKLVRERCRQLIEKYIQFQSLKQTELVSFEFTANDHKIEQFQDKIRESTRQTEKLKKENQKFKFAILQYEKLKEKIKKYEDLQNKFKIVSDNFEREQHKNNTLSSQKQSLYNQNIQLKKTKTELQQQIKKQTELPKSQNANTMPIQPGTGACCELI